MAINYPTSLDTLTNPTSTDQVAVVSHASQHANTNDILEALEAKVGVNSSAVTTSHDYKLSEVISTDKAVGKTATQVLSNKTLTTPKIVTGGSITDENGNKQIEFATTASAVNDIKVTNSATGNAPTVGASGTDSNIDLSLVGKGTGKVKLGTAGIKFPNADGTSGQVIQTDGAGVLTFITPSTTDPALLPQSTYFSNMTGSSNELVYNQYCDATQFALMSRTGTTVSYVNSGVAGYQTRNLTSDWASAAEITSCVSLGAFLYIMIRDASNNYRIYRYAVGALSSGGTLMTISGQAFATTGGAAVMMTSNGTNFYFNYKAGNNASDRIISKYTISGTTLTYSSDITCGASSNVANQIIRVDSSENIYGWYRSPDLGGDNKVRKYNSSGTLQTTSEAYASSQIWRTVFTFGTASYINYTVATNPWYYLIRIFL